MRIALMSKKHYTMKNNRIILCSMLASSMAVSAKQMNAVDSLKEKRDTIQLQEVVVKGTKPLTTISGDGFVTVVKGTILEKLGDAKSVLGILPGVLNNNGTIEVVGKGKPFFYINGRPVYDDAEIDRLRADQIDKVKVITSPGARYSAYISSVIRITTKKEQGEGLSIDNTTTLGFRNYLYGKDNLSINYRYNKLNILCDLAYDKNKTKSSSDNIQDSWLHSHLQQLVGLNGTAKQQVYKGKWGFYYSPSSNHSFGAYYQVTSQPSTVHAQHSSSSWEDEVCIEENHVDRILKTKMLTHLVDGYYAGVLGKLTIDATFDFMWKTNHENQDMVTQVADNSQNILTRDKNKGRMYAGELNLSYPLWKGTLDFGMESTYSKRHDWFDTVESFLETKDNYVRETNMAFYVETMQRLGKVSLRLGGRYEHTDNAYFENDIKIKEQSRIYDHFFPTAMLNIPLGVAMLQLSYSKQNTRPLYSQLSSTVHYVNNYLYQSGNPRLRTSYTDVISLNYKYKWLMLMATYKHITDQIITSCSYYDNNQRITLMKKDNSPYDLNELQVIASVMPGFIAKCYYPVFMLGTSAQFYKIDYRNDVKHLNTPMLIARVNNIIRLHHNYTLTADCSWRGKGHGENIMLGETWQVNCSIAKIFNKHWDIKVSANDIGNTARKTHFTLYSGVQDFSTMKYATKRSVECSVRYKLNVTKSKYKGQGAGKEERMRF